MEKKMSDQNLVMTEFVEKWKEIKTMVEVLELDVVKYSRGTRVAGLRVRKGMRELKRAMSDFVRMSVAEDREIRESKKSDKG
jgi:hypothetical protein